MSNTIKAGAFADPSATKPNPRLPVLDTEDVPFAKLLVPTAKQPPGQTEACKQLDNNENNNTTKTSTESNSRRSSCSAADDFIMVDLVGLTLIYVYIFYNANLFPQKTPFAGGNVNSDLGAFYRECQTAPPLQTFAEQPTLAEQVSALPSQLEMFEQNRAEFDALLSNLISQPSIT